MDRRTFLARAALIVAGAVAADQVELLERLTHRRRFFAGCDFARRVSNAHGVVTDIDLRGGTITVEWCGDWREGIDGLAIYAEPNPRLPWRVL